MGRARAALRGSAVISDIPPAEQTASFLVGKLLEPTEPNRFTIISVPAPVAPLEAFMDAAPADMGLAWHPPRGLSCAAGGVAKLFPVQGSDLASVQAGIEA